MHWLSGLYREREQHFLSLACVVQRVCERAAKMCVYEGGRRGGLGGSVGDCPRTFADVEVMISRDRVRLLKVNVGMWFRVIFRGIVSFFNLMKYLLREINRCIMKTIKNTLRLK